MDSLIDIRAKDLADDVAERWPAAADEVRTVSLTQWARRAVTRHRGLDHLAAVADSALWLSEELEAGRKKLVRRSLTNVFARAARSRRFRYHAADGEDSPFADDPVAVEPPRVEPVELPHPLKSPTAYARLARANLGAVGDLPPAVLAALVGHTPDSMAWVDEHRDRARFTAAIGHDLSARFRRGDTDGWREVVEASARRWGVALPPDDVLVYVLNAGLYVATRDLPQPGPFFAADYTTARRA